MADTTTRLALPFPELTDTPDVPRDIEALADALDTAVAVDAQGSVGARPAAGTVGRYYWATDESVLYRDDGGAWRDLTRMPLGTALLPGLTFVGDPDTGIFSSGANTINLAVGGVSRFLLSATALVVAAQLQNTAGSVATPSISFSGDPDSGFYSSGANKVAVGGDGQLLMEWDRAGVITAKKEVQRSGTMAADLIVSGRIAAEAGRRYQLNLDGHMYFGPDGVSYDVEVERLQAGVLGIKRGVRIDATTLPSNNMALYISANGTLPGYALLAQSEVTGTPNTRFYVTGVGEVYADGTFHGGGADYAEYFETDQDDIEVGDIIGLHHGKARRYQEGDRLIGICSSGGGFAGNSPKPKNDPETNEPIPPDLAGLVLVGLIGQVDVDPDQIEEDDDRNVTTIDGKDVGYRLTNGKVYISL